MLEEQRKHRRDLPELFGNDTRVHACNWRSLAHIIWYDMVDWEAELLLRPLRALCDAGRNEENGDYSSGSIGIYPKAGFLELF